MSSDKFHCTNGYCLTDCVLSSIDYYKDFPPRFCPHSGGVVCWKKCETTEKKPSFFDQITASPEVLAPKLVYVSLFNACWYSTLTGDVMYKSREEAEAATVAELNKVAK